MSHVHFLALHGAEVTGQHAYGRKELRLLTYGTQSILVLVRRLRERPVLLALKA